MTNPRADKIIADIEAMTDSDELNGYVWGIKTSGETTLPGVAIAIVRKQRATGWVYEAPFPEMPKNEV